MKKIATVLVLCFLVFRVHAQKGFEIYLADIPITVNTQEDNRKCQYCISPSKNDLHDVPLISESDIDYFDWENQTVVLNDVGKDKIKDLSIPLPGLAAAIAIDGEPIYGLWLWNLVSSFGCDWVCTYPKGDFVIRFGLPSNYAYGEDPRFDKQLASYVKEKLKKN